MKTLATFGDATPAWAIVTDSSLTNVYPQLRWATTGLTAGSSVWVMGAASTPIYLRLTGGGSSVYGSTPTFGYAYYDAATAGNEVTNATPTGSVVWSGAPTATSNAGIYSLTYSSGITLGNSAYSVAAGSAVNWTVNPAPLTITASNTTKTYGDSGSLTSFSAPGLKNSDTIGSVSLSSTGTAATATVAGGPYTITASGATGGTFNPSNYSISYASGSLTVAPRPISVTAINGATRTYDATNRIDSSLLIVGNTVNGDTVTISGSATLAGSDVGTQAVVSSTGLSVSNPNYTGTGGSGSGSVAITPAALTIAASNASKVYGQTAALSGVTVDGLVGGQTVDRQSVTLSSAGAPATAGVAASPYPITITGTATGTFSPSNYEISYVNGSLTVSPLPVSVATVSGATRPYDATANVAASLLNVTNAVNGDTVTLSGTGTLVGRNAGTEPLSSLAGLTLSNPNYTTAGGTTSGSVAVTALPVTIATVAGASRAYDATTNVAASLLTVTNAINGETVPLSGNGTLAGSNVGSQALTSIAGVRIDSPNYTTTGASQSGSVAVTPAALTIAGNNTSKVYGQTPTLTGFTATGLVGGQTIDSVTLASAGTAATAGVVSSPYPITVSNATGGTFTPGNYNISYSSDGKLTVTPLPVAVATVNGATRVYDATTNVAASLLTVSNAINGDTVALGGSGTLAGSNVGPEALSSIAGLTLNNPNYTMTGASKSGSVAVTPAPLTITANSVTKAYGQTPVFAGFTATGLQGGQTVGSVTLTSTGSAATAGVAASPYAITVSDATGGTFTPGNYTIAYATDGKLTVTPIPVAVAAVAGATREFDNTANAQASLLTASNAINGDVITLSGNGTLAGSAVGTQALASVAGISQSNPNYTLTGATVSGSVQVTLPQAVIASAGSQVPTSSNAASNAPGLSGPGNILGGNAPGVVAGGPNTSPFSVVNPLPQVSAAFGANTPLMVVSSPSANEPTQAVNMAQVSTMLQAPGVNLAGITPDVRVPVSRNSLAEIVNGGVLLPGGVDQLLYVVKASAEDKQ